MTMQKRIAAIAFIASAGIATSAFGQTSSDRRDMGTGVRDGTTGSGVDGAE